MSAPILSSYDWQIQGLGTRHLRAGFLTDTGTGKLQVRTTGPNNDTVVWENLLVGLNSSSFNFTSFWNLANAQDLLLFVNGQPGIFEWTGGLAYLDAATASSGVISQVNMAPTFGGSGYTVGDELTVTGGGGTGGKVKVQALSTFAVTGINVVPFAAGNGYLVNDILTLVGGSGATVKVLTIGGGGTVLTVQLMTQGSQYIVGNLNTTTTGGGTGCKITVTTTGSGVVSAVAADAGGQGYSTGAGLAVSGGTGTGATVEITEVLTGSITIKGDKTVAQENFYLGDGSVTGKLLINDTLYTYQRTVGNDFVGISPSAASETVDSLILQAVKFTLNSAMVDMNDTFANQLIATINNYVFVGDLGSNQVYISKNTDCYDFSFASPRIPGDGALLVLDSSAVAFIAQEDTMYISAGLDEWYQVVFTLSADLVNETVIPTRLKTTTGQGTQSQGLTSKIADNVIYVSNEPIINTLGRVTNVVLTPQITDISYPIVNDINSYDFTDGSIFYFQKYIYVAIPKESIVRIYNMTNEAKKYYWEAPQILPISRFSIIDGELYGHSYQASETYKLFVGYNDNTHPYTAIAAFSYQQDGVRSSSKSFNEFYSEGYISANTILTNGFNFDTDGFQTSTSFLINGSDTQIVGIKPSLVSLGKSSMGKNPLGGDADLTNINTLPPKFRVIKTFPRVPYYEYQPYYSSLGVDQQWELIAFGAATSPSTEDNGPITQ